MMNLELCRRSVWAGLIATVLMGTVAASESETTPTIDVSDLRVLDVSGRIHALGESDGIDAIAMVFISTECPISRKYIPELNRLSAETGESILFYAVLSDASVERSDAASFIKEFKVAFPVLFDTSGDLAAQFQPTHVPEAFLIHPRGELLYRGRIDDLYADVDKRRTTATTRDFHQALVAVAEGREVEVARTMAVGCKFESFKSPADSQVTYNRHIAPILLANCAECHRSGEVAPFSLLTYDDAAKRSEWIADVTADRLMPPWKAEQGHGHFLGARRLSQRQVDLIAAWHEAGAPQGDAANLPVTPEFASGWRLGEPDLVLEATHDFPVPADGPDVFQHYWVPIDIPEDKVIVGYEFRPGNPLVVHHAILFLDSFQGSRKLDAATPEPGWTSSGSIDASISGLLGVWTPGFTPRYFPGGAGMPVSKGTDLVVQLHLSPSGKPETDRSRVGLYFADKPVPVTMSRNPLVLGSVAIDVPPGEKRHRVSMSAELPAEVTLFSLFPHMHKIAKEMKVTATLPSGEEQSLIWIKDWNFYWQDAYVYSDPLVLPAGTKLDLEAYYDNSAENPFNPSTPPKPVRFGNNSSDEMCFLICQAIENQGESSGAVMRSTAGSMMQEFVKADLSPEARTYIMTEVMKLFGTGRRSRAMERYSRDRPDNL